MSILFSDIRSFTTPEMFAEIKMNFTERAGASQETDVVAIDAEVLDAIDVTRLSTGQLTGLTTTSIDALAATQVGSLTSTQVRLLSAGQIGALSSTEIQAFTATQNAALTAAQFGGLSNATLELFSLDQFAAEKIGDRYLLVLDRLCDLGEKRIAEMDAAGIDMQVLSLSAPGVEQMEPADAIAMATHGHRFLEDLVKGTTVDKVRHLVTVPVLLLKHTE